MENDKAPEGYEPKEIDQYDKYEQGILDYCFNLQQSLLGKYRKGKIEHGTESQATIDAAKEVVDEVRDIIVYHIMDMINKEGRDG